MPEPITSSAPAPTTQSPPPAPPPVASNPPSGAGGVGVTPAAGATSQPVPTQTPAISADVQAQLDRYRAMEGEYQQLNQYRHLIPLGYRAYQQSGQPNPAAPQQPKTEHPWGLPDFDQNLLNLVRRDPATNELVALPGAPPDALLRVQDYQAKARQAHEKLLTDPVNAIWSAIEAKVRATYQEQFGQQYGQIQQQQTTQQIIQQNSDWLYAKDQQGNAVTSFDPSTGQHKPTLSPYGQQYVQFVRQAVAWGVQDPTAQHNIAVQGLQNMLLSQRYQQGQQQQVGQQQQQQFVQNAAQTTAAAALLNNNPSTTPSAPSALSLRDKMRQRMNASGQTDDVIRQQV